MERGATATDQKGGPMERTTRSKLGDVVIIAIILIIAIIMEFQIISIDPHQQFIPGLDNVTNLNYNFAYPHLESTVSSAELVLLVILLPWISLLVVSLVILYFADEEFSWRQYLKQLYLIHRMVFFCFAATLLCCDCIKLFVGAPRPYYLSVHGDEDREEELDGRLSFISGHSSTGLAPCLLLSIMLFESWRYTQRIHFEKMSVDGMKCDNPHCYYLSGLWWKLRDVPLLSILLIGVPTYIAVWNGLTRIRDYKHFAADVVGGWVVGGFIAFASYLIFYQETYFVFNRELMSKINKTRIAERKRAHQDDSDEPLNVIVEQVEVASQKEEVP